MDEFFANGAYRTALRMYMLQSQYLKMNTVPPSLETLAVSSGQACGLTGSDDVMT